jgi:hypothetical protein
MSIYVLRADNIVKIGFTDDLAARVRTIISSTPMKVEFVGHMPGDRELERHFHSRFDATRFSGEWFVETDEMKAVWAAVLIPHIPSEEKPKDRKKLASEGEARSTQERLRNAAAHLWPEEGHGRRIGLLSERLGWNRSRVKDFYYGDQRVVLRSFETDEIDGLLEPIRAMAGLSDRT